MRITLTRSLQNVISPAGAAWRIVSAVPNWLTTCVLSLKQRACKICTTDWPYGGFSGGNLNEKEGPGAEAPGKRTTKTKNTEPKPKPCFPRTHPSPLHWWRLEMIEMWAPFWIQGNLPLDPRATAPGELEEKWEKPKSSGGRPPNQ